MIKNPVEPLPDKVTNAIRIITNIEYRLSTIYVPQITDTIRYTNLYVDSTNLLAQVEILTNEINDLQDKINKQNIFIGAGYIRGDIPVAIGAGVQWREWIGEATISFSGLSSLMVYRKF